jgi:hypothetical protein
MLLRARETARSTREAVAALQRLGRVEADAREEEGGPFLTSSLAASVVAIIRPLPERTQHVGGGVWLGDLFLDDVAVGA